MIYSLQPFSYDNTVVNRCFLKPKEVPVFAFLQKPNILHSPFNIDGKYTNVTGQEKCQAPEFYSVMTTLTYISTIYDMYTGIIRLIL